MIDIGFWLQEVRVGEHQVMLSSGGAGVVGGGWSFDSPTLSRQMPEKRPSDEEIERLAGIVVAEYEQFLAERQARSDAAQQRP